MMEIEAEKVCECGAVVDAPEFRFDRCEQIDGFWYHWLGDERVPRHAFGLLGGELVIKVGQ